MQSTKSDILRLAESDFIRWLRAGLLQIPHLTSAPLDKTDLLVQMPAKYARVTDKGQTVVALIDEIVSISKLTPELTREFTARLHNLGESWLPISYHPEWQPELAQRTIVTTVTAVTAEPVGRETLASLDSHEEAASSKKEDSSEVPDTPEQEQPQSPGSEGRGEHGLPLSEMEEQPLVAQALGAMVFEPSDLSPVQTNMGVQLPDTTVDEQRSHDGASTSKAPGGSSTPKTDKKRTTAVRTKQAQSSLLPGPGSDADERQGRNEGMHD